jgi:cation transport regulator ChaB
MPVPKHEDISQVLVIAPYTIYNYIFIYPFLPKKRGNYSSQPCAQEVLDAAVQKRVQLNEDNME